MARTMATTRTEGERREKRILLRLARLKDLPVFGLLNLSLWRIVCRATDETREPCATHHSVSIKCAALGKWGYY